MLTTLEHDSWPKANVTITCITLGISEASLTTIEAKYEYLGIFNDAADRLEPNW